MITWITLKKANNTRAFVQRNASTAYQGSLLRDKKDTTTRVCINIVGSSNRTELVQTRICAAQYVQKDFDYCERVTSMLDKLEWLTLQHRRKEAKVLLPSLHTSISSSYWSWFTLSAVLHQGVSMQILIHIDGYTNLERTSNRPHLKAVPRNLYT